jgi:hypothetical protein
LKDFQEAAHYSKLVADDTDTDGQQNDGFCLDNGQNI